MKVSLLILVLCASAALVSGQVATDSELQSNGPREAPLPTATAEPTVPERAQIDEIFKQTSLGKEADERRLHIEWRSLQNRGNENSARPIKNRACEPDHAGTSATRDRQCFADTKSDAEKEKEGESRQEVSARGLISDSGPETQHRRALERSLLMEGRIRVVLRRPGTINLRT